LNSLGRFQMSTTRQGRTAVRRVGYRARLPTCSRLVDAQVGGAQRAVRRTRSVAPSRVLAASRPSVDHEHDRQLTLRGPVDGFGERLRVKKLAIRPSAR
jgi:hypothetical protein